MSNSGFVKSLEKLGVTCVQTAVGDRYVYECMQAHGYSLGGEQSGHVILKKYATTGDGILTAIMLCEEMCDQKSPLSKLYASLRVYPQYTKNVRVKDKNSALSDSVVLGAVENAEKAVEGRGRVLIRKSGTEPLIRIMVECEDISLCHSCAEDIALAIKNGGHASEQ